MTALSPAARRALDALCRTMAPFAFEPDGPDAVAFDPVAAVERRVIESGGELARRVDRVLALFDRTAALAAGRLGPFSSLPPATRARVLRGWERSALPARRALFQVLRRLILATCYTRPEALAAIGWLGPYHLRAPALDWEGPLPGETTDDEPIARATAAARLAAADRDPRNATATVGAGPIGGAVRADPPPLPAFPSARTLAPGVVLRADACVIGSGAGGAVAAARLAEAGLDVVVLEEGGFWPRTERTEDEAVMTQRLYAEGAGRFTDDFSLLLLQGRGIGGGTTVNWMITLRPAPWVMTQWSRDFGAVLLGEDALVPELARVEEEIHARLVPDDAHAPNNRIILDGAARLGWRATPARINARGCLRTGFCGLGCRYGAKQDAGEVYLRGAAARGARIYADARADRLHRSGSGWSVEAAGLATVGGSHDRGDDGGIPGERVRSAVAGGSTGTAAPAGGLRFTVEADTVVVAAGAVGTPALLQRSGLGGPDVGRHLRLHPTTAVVGTYDRVIYPAAGIPQSSVCTEFMDANGGYGFWIECPPMLPALAAASLAGYGAEHRRRMRALPHTGALIVLVRDGAGSDRSQGEVRVRRGGGLRIRYRLRVPEWRTLDAGLRAAARLHLAAGATEAWSLHADARPLRSEGDVETARFQRGRNRLALFSAHVNGTCRMTGEAARGPCAPDGSVRGAPGVYLADGSLFPTAPGVNPQATIMALASLVARGISDRRRPS